MPVKPSRLSQPAAVGTVLIRTRFSSALGYGYLAPLDGDKPADRSFDEAIHTACTDLRLQPGDVVLITLAKVGKVE